MNADSRDPLDRLLATWAEGKAVPPERLRQLEERIATGLDREPLLQAGSVEAPSRHRWTGTALGFVAGVAATLLVALILWQPGTPPASEVGAAKGVQSPEPPASAVLSQHDIAEKSRLLSAVDQQFDGELAWLSERDGDVDLQVGKARDAFRGEGLLLRMVMMRRSLDASEWKEVWATDVVTYSEQMVTKIPGTSEASVWAYVLPDGLISLDSDLRLQGVLGAHVKFSGLLRSGVPREVFSMQTADEEYRLFQTVVRLSGGAA